MMNTMKKGTSFARSFFITYLHPFPSVLTPNTKRTMKSIIVLLSLTMNMQFN
ncbi:hypothetical protein FC37_GL000899 [Lactobacillus gallinarum DSM 10532 = JCM 2011]|uniref:Uncharacterized protein n=1 Tax=Lactobacillus gallinarum DSM 10532 = JCM 2011 TaxID=1423748 RepID=A0A0R1NSY5_9LACO|nr:hypothetical protein FC37_GL000899 [Lactobacillus gallinarum DSM 10532 = JCM 2011]